MLGNKLQATEFQNYIMEQIYRVTLEESLWTRLGHASLWSILSYAPAGSPLREFFLDFWSTHCLSTDHLLPEKRRFSDLLVNFKDARDCLIEAVIAPSEKRVIKSKDNYIFKGV
jgi:hypothetical protein